jgi:DNA polymerase III epsilon subunit-like protein
MSKRPRPSGNFIGDIYISVDVETSGSHPQDYDLLSIGAAVVGDVNTNFYVELKPSTMHYDPKAMAVHGLDPKKLVKMGVFPAKAAPMFVKWVRVIAGNRRPVFCSFGTFDWMWTGHFLGHFWGDYKEPFGPNTLDLKSYYMGWQGTDWSGTQKRNMTNHHLSTKRHTHNALEDAIEQAVMFEIWLRERGLWK